MALSSIELASRCHQRGLLSKEAMDDVLRTRSRLIKEALAKEAGSLFKNLGERVSGAFAHAGPHDPLGRSATPAGELLSSVKKHLGFGGMSGPTPVIARTGKDAGKVIGREPLSWAGAGANIAKMLALGGALAAGSAGAHGLMRHSRDKKLRNEIENSYGQMFHETPGLDNLDKDKVRRNFGVLARYAPSIAAEPVVAGAWVKGTVQMGHIDADAVNKLSATQAIIDRHHEGRALFQPGQFTASVNLARQAMGGSGGGGSGGH